MDLDKRRAPYRPMRFGNFNLENPRDIEDSFVFTVVVKYVDVHRQTSVKSLYYFAERSVVRLGLAPALHQIIKS